MRMLTKACVHTDWPLWSEAIEEELDTLHAAGTWVFDAMLPNAVRRVAMARMPKMFAPNAMLPPT